MFTFFKKRRSLTIIAPMSGKYIPLENVPDPVFSEKIMGNGIAIEPTDGNVYSPIDGEVILIPPTKHAIGLRAVDGTEILIHIGLETVTLDGNGFHLLVDVGDKITVGQKLAEVQLNYIRTHAKSIVTPIVITNDSDGKKTYTIPNPKEVIGGKTEVLTITEN
ncbi:PTS sugar transporter subunit IIA [Fervidibacillus halotolerans]|uniref:PTS glucose transporter subunit IIA n=1 Tax=Fervidibacillus halotolerans TaxID=2980027 RepID=A0A9E8LYG0_9BACI|nr:PTS glucose transporter subunit IIA [Fervidibacillus halotolerans]WAA12055.1 PTS glucose transporter subunit IIA [Fervidibacillus halotolerans]